ncbi:hypothetical protein PENTCL1PPCAC_14605 [Pristionchus entomophagus]|uniref:Uncharacterized protein n=1 Tax=Pristionchus entomophagus TaxID=358040 RepID=A0AAV5TG28_9BILA|nr:hypothetical protein PENTCL1PPCAC_14605 [Pristionchus entomophagus]
MANLKEIIVRYESEEEEFARELEEMRAKIASAQSSARPSEDEADEADGESDVPQDPQPILTVLCDLVDEIGTLRNENRRLKTRLSLPRPRSRQTVVERMSALLDGALFPRLKRPAIAAATTAAAAAARSQIGGARERLSTPPPKDALTASSISTDLSSLDSARSLQRRQLLLAARPVPLVQPEVSDSDFDENVFEESEEGDISSAPESKRRARRETRAGQETVARRRVDNSSDCTSPSSASSSRDVSEAMTTSRSSFLEILGVKKRKERPSALALLGVGRGAADKKRRSRQRRASNELKEGDVLLDANGELVGRKRDTAANKRQSCRFTLNDDLLTDDGGGDKHYSSVYLSGSSAAPSPLPPHAKSDTMLLNHVLTRHESEKDNLRAEIEELKTRNSRLLDQLREKSMLMAHVQTHSKSLEKQVEQLHQRCVLSEALDKLSLDDRLNARPTRTLEKVEELLRLFQAEMQHAKAEANNAHQMVIEPGNGIGAYDTAQTLSACTHERTCYRNCLEQIERLQKENFCLIRSRLIDSDDSAVRHRLAMMPSYDALYTFAMRVVRKLGVVRQTLLERCTELSRTEVDLISSQSTLLVTHAQIERLRLQHGKRRRRRCASWHGADGAEKRVHANLNFFLPFRLQSTRVANGRAAAKILPKEVIADGIENEFISLFGHARALSRIAASQQQQQPSPPSTARHRRRVADDGQHRPLPPVSPPRSPQLGHYAQPPQHRIQRRASGSSRSTRWPTPQQVLAAAHAAAVEQQQHIYGQLMQHQQRDDGRERATTAMGQDRRRQRPVSLVECEGRLVNGGAAARNDARRRSQRGHATADHERMGSGGDGGAKTTARREERTVGFSDVRAVTSLQDVSNPRTPQTTPQLTRRLAPATHSSGGYGRSVGWTSQDHVPPPMRDETTKRAPSRLERARPVQNRVRPPSVMRNPDKRCGTGAAGGALLSGSWEESRTPPSPMTNSKSPPTSPKASRLPMRSGAGPTPPAPPQNETPKGLSWLSKLKHYKNSAK